MRLCVPPPASAPTVAAPGRYERLAMLANRRQAHGHRVRAFTLAAPAHHPQAAASYGLTTRQGGWNMPEAVGGCAPLLLASESRLAGEEGGTPRCAKPEPGACLQPSKSARSTAPCGLGAAVRKRPAALSSLWVGVASVMRQCAPEKRARHTKRPRPTAVPAIMRA